MRMVWTKGTLPDGECAPRKRLRLLEPALRRVNLRHVIQRAGDLGMVGTKDFFSNGRGACKERKGFLRFAKIRVHGTEGEKPVDQTRILWTHSCLGNLHGFEGFGASLRITALGAIQLSDIVQNIGGLNG